MAAQPSTLSTVSVSGTIHKTENALHPVIMVFIKGTEKYLTILMACARLYQFVWQTALRAFSLLEVWHPGSGPI